MNKEFENFKEYVDKMNYSIQGKLDSEELEFYQKLTKRFNDVCKDKEMLERALEKIKEICDEIPITWGIVDTGKIQEIEKIINGVKNEEKCPKRQKSSMRE